MPEWEKDPVVGGNAWESDPIVDTQEPPPMSQLMDSAIKMSGPFPTGSGGGFLSGLAHGASEGYGFVTKPLVNIGAELLIPDPIARLAMREVSKLPGPMGTTAGTVLGTAEGIGDVASSLTSLLGLATLGAGALPKAGQAALTAAFGADMVRHVPAQATELGRLSVEGTPQEIARSGTGLGVSSVLGPTLLGTGGTKLVRSRIEAVKAGKATAQAEAAAFEPIITKQPATLTESIPAALNIAPEVFAEAPPSGLGLAQEIAPTPVSAQIKATPEMLEVLPDLVFQQRTGQILPEQNVLPGRPVDPSPVIEPTRRVEAIGKQMVQPEPSGQVIVPPEPRGNFVVDERGAVIPVEEPGAISRRELGTLKSQEKVTPESVPLSEAVSRREAETLYASPDGTITRGPSAPKTRKTGETIQERIELENEYDRQVQEALDMQSAIVFEEAKVSPKTIDKSLPTRETISPEESQQVATQFQQRVPSEQVRGLTEFNRPADPQIGKPKPEPIQQAPWTFEDYMVNFEKWADGVISESRGRSYTGVDPQLMAAYVVKGAALLAKGVVNTAEWTAAMLKEYGPSIKPHLKLIKTQAEKTRAQYFSPERNDAIQKQEAGAPVLRLSEPQVQGQGQMPIQKSNQGLPETQEANVGLKGLYQKIKDNWKANRESANRELILMNLETDTITPDFNPLNVNKNNFTKAFGAERIPFVGKLFSPRSGSVDSKVNSLINLAAEKQIGKANTSAFGQQISGQFDKYFPQNEFGEVTNITPNKAGLSLNLGDVFENLQKDPNAYNLSPEQRQVFDTIQKFEKDFRKLEDKYQMFQDGSGEYTPGKPSRRAQYFSRLITQRPNERSVGNRGGLGSKPTQLKERVFESEKDGTSKGYRYEQSIEKRLVNRMDRLYKYIAEKRFTEDPALGSMSKADYIESLKQYYAEEIGSGKITPERFDQIVEGAVRDRSVNQPGFAGKVFDLPVVKFLNEELAFESKGMRRAVSDVTNALKEVKLSLDLGVGMIQLQSLFFKHPRVWGNAMFNGVRALTNPQLFPNYVRMNLENVRELAQLGSSVGRLQDLIQGGGTRFNLEGVKYLGAPFRVFQRSFQTSMDVAKVELWKAYKESYPKEQWSDLAQAIEAYVGTARIEGSGVSSRQAFIERNSFLATGYYRGALNMIGNLARKDASGAFTKKAIASYAAGGAALYYGIGKLIGMDDETLKSRFNPTKPDFMMWTYKQGGQTINIGLGGIYKSLIRLGAKVTKTAKENPENFKSLDSQKNPLTGWLRGHAAAVPSLMWDAAGRDYRGGETDVGTLFNSVLPLPIQPFLRPEEDPKATSGEVAASFTGLSSYPVNQGTQKKEEREKIIKEMGKDPAKLSIQDAYKVGLELKKRFPIKEDATERQISLARKANMERQKRVAATVVAKDDLSRLKLKVAGYSPSFVLNGVTINLNDEDEKVLEGFVIDEYNKIIPRILPRIEKLQPYLRQDFLNDRLTEARKVAREKMFSFMSKRANPGPLKP